MMKEAKTLHILLVEDDKADAEISQKAFRNSKITNYLHVVGDGSEALDYVFHKGLYQDERKFPQPDIIFLDIQLPKTDGFEVLKQLKADDRYTLIPVIMLTGSKGEGEAFRSFGNGAVSYIQKPVTDEIFNEVMSGFHQYCDSVKDPSQQ